MARYKVPQSAVDNLANSAEMEALLLRAAQAGAEGASRRAPRDTGRLADSYKAESEPGKAWFGTDVEYADDVEFGEE